MQPPGPNRLIAPIAVAIAVWSVWSVWLPAPIGAQAPGATGGSPTGGEAAAPAIEPIPMDGVSKRAETVLGELDAFLPGEDSRQAIERIGSELEPMLGEVKSRLGKTRIALKSEPTVTSLRSLDAQLREALDRLRPLDTELDTLAAGPREALEKLDLLGATWKATAELARQEKAANTTSSRIADVRHEIARTRAAVVAHRDQLLAVRDRLVDPTSELRASLEDVEGAAATRLEGAFRVDRPPPWSPEVRESLRKEWQTESLQQVMQPLQDGADFARDHRGELAFHVALLVLLGLGLRTLRDRARARAEDEYNLREAKEVFERPWSMALILSFFLLFPFYTLAPPVVRLFISPLMALAALSIGQRLLVRTMAPLVWGLMGLFVVDQLRVLLESTPTLERFFSLAELVAALGLLLWLQRPRRLARIPPELRRSAFLRVLGGTMRLGTALLTLAFVTDLAGFGGLSSLVGNGVLRCGMFGVFVFVLLKVVQGLATFGLVLWPLRLVRGISRHRLLVRRRLERVLNVAAVALWSWLALRELSLLAPVRDGLREALDAGISVGALSITLGDVMAFFLTIWLSLGLARLVDFVLQEDVFTRVRTGRGVPYAVSGLVRYTLIFLGFLVGLAAAGVELAKLTVIAGGLGVGIGFGLQNVVNNFVSGLILLFERPIQVGDTVQLPDVWGDMKRIGLRSSVIRTFDGAEVIVPNGMLVSEKVTNWTLSDKRRRVEVDVGVVYGTPAPRVIELLLEVAKANSRVLDDPEPRAFFMAFGDSSLNFKLRAWIPTFDDGFAIRSELTVAVQAALAEANITVPFPQRDLHLISVNPNLSPEPPSPDR